MYSKEDMNYLTREDVAARLGCSPRTIDKAIKSGRLVVFRIGRLIRITEDSFNNYINMAGKKGTHV